MNEYLVFETEVQAQAALEIIYSNMVKAIESPDLLDVSTNTVVEKEDLTPDQAVQVNAGNRHFPVFGVNAATQTKNTAHGYTTAWAVAQETAQGKWVFPKPPEELLQGLNGFTIEEFNYSWFPQTVLD